MANAIIRGVCCKALQSPASGCISSNSARQAKGKGWRCVVKELNSRKWLLIMLWFQCFYATGRIVEQTFITTQASLLLFFQKLYTGKYVRIAFWLAVGIVITYGTWAFLTNVFICWPLQVDGVSSIASSTSNKYLYPYKALLACKLLVSWIDVFMILLTLPLLRHLVSPRCQKLGLAAAISISFL